LKVKKKRKPKPKAIPVGQIDDSPDWKRIRWIAAAVILAAAALCAVTFISSAPRSLTAEDRQFLGAYEQVRRALAADQLATARTAAASMAAEPAPMGAAAKRLEASASLESAREEFTTLSTRAVALAARRPGLFVMQCIEPCPAHCLQCPMDRFGKWVQTTPEVANPFMGRAKSGCGRFAPL
jgi:hypothetical protein